MIKVLYYFYYLFYTKIAPDDEPHATTIFSLSLILSFIINGLLNIILACLFSLTLGKWAMIGIFVLILFGNYFIFSRSGKGRKIVEFEKPLIFQNKTLSISFAVIIFILAIFFITAGAVITRIILEN